MAGRAIGGDAVVIPIGRAEGKRVPVAGFARRRRRHMGGRLATGVRTIVTARARAESLAMVLANLTPRRGHMAGFAAVACWCVRTAFSAGTGPVVAARTLPRRTPEAGVDVAGSAINSDVAAGEREARRKMVERRTTTSLAIARFGAEQRCKQRQASAQNRWSETRTDNSGEAIPHPQRPRAHSPRLSSLLPGGSTPHLPHHAVRSSFSTQDTARNEHTFAERQRSSSSSVGRCRCSGFARCPSPTWDEWLRARV